MAVLKFKRPNNNYVEEFSTTNAFIVTLLVGPVYFMVKGIWTHAAASLFLALLTGGLSWLIYPFFAKQIVIKHYLKSGYEQVSSN